MDHDQGEETDTGRGAKGGDLGADDGQMGAVCASVRDLTDLTAAIDSRTHRIAIAPEFAGWEAQAGERPSGQHYVFLPQAEGVYPCEQIRHPDSSVSSGEIFDRLGRLILGGTEVVFELDPAQQSAVRFCERLLATLSVEDNARAHAHVPFAERLVRQTDQAARDGIGPTTLPVPIVVGYTAAENTRCLAIKHPAVMWSCRWHLAVDPTEQVVDLVRKCITGQLTRSPNPIAASPVRPRTVGATSLGTAIACQLVDGAASLTRAEFLEHVQHVIGAIIDCSGITAGDVEAVVADWDATIRENRTGVQDRLMMCLQAPASAVYSQAASSFPAGTFLLCDCWGHPVAFTWLFAMGRVTVLPVGGHIPCQSNEQGKEQVDNGALARIEDASKKTLTAVENLRPHIEGVPPLVKRSEEAMSVPLAAADELRRRWPLTPKETQFRDALVHHGGCGKAAAAELGVSEATVSRYKARIIDKMGVAGIPRTLVFRPSTQFRAHEVPPKNPGEPKSREIERVDTDWRRDKAERESTIKMYRSASAEDKAIMRETYPDIDAEAHAKGTDEDQ